VSAASKPASHGRPRLQPRLRPLQPVSPVTQDVSANQPHTSPPASDATPTLEPNDADLPDWPPFSRPPTQALSTEETKDSAAESSGKDEQPKTLGEAPKETHTEMQFLRRQSVLLDPGEYQIDVTLQYLVDETDFAMAEIDGDVLTIGEAVRRQRLLLLPIEFRLGVSPVTQVFVNVPFGWSNSEFSFAGTDEFSNTGGIGDVSAGLVRLLLEGHAAFPDVLGTLSFSAPTGNADLVSSLSTPGSSLGEGFWSVTMGLTFIQTYDPIVLFYGFGYRHRFDAEFEGDVSVEPGEHAYYRFGGGFAVNPRVTLSASFMGSYIGAMKVNGVRVAGDIREPMQVRLAATIVRDGKCKSQGKGQGKGRSSVRTIEPFIDFGVTEGAIDSVIGISWTR